VVLSADRAHRENSARRELLSEQLGRLLLQRVRVLLGAGLAVTISSKKKSAITPWLWPWATFAASATMPKPSSHRASAGTGILRRAESSITIELA
jgi:hypothetical protein